MLFKHRILIKYITSFLKRCNLRNKRQRILVGCISLRQDSTFASREKHILVDGKRKEFQEMFKEKRLRKRNYRKK